MASKNWLRIDRWLAGKGGSQLVIPAIAAGIVFLFTCLVWLLCSTLCRCFSYTIPDGYTADNIFDGAFYTLFANGGQNLFPGSHFLGAIITVLGILVLAVVTSAITNFFEKRAEGYLSGETAYKLKDHIVILGTADVIYSIINQCYKSGQQILVQTSKDVKQTRREVFSFLHKNIKRNDIVFIYGDRTSAEDVANLSLPYAKEIFIVGDSIEGAEHDSYRDAYNMDSVDAIAKVLNASACVGRIPCHVLFEYQTTFSAFQFAELSSEINTHIEFKPFNFHEMWAQKVLISGKAGYDVNTNTYATTYKFLDEKKDGSYISESSNETVHLIIVGMSKIGVALAIEAAHLLHFPNYVRNKSKRTRITFIDENADKEKDFFTGRFKELFQLSRYRYADADANENSKLNLIGNAWIEPQEDWLDIEWEFIKGRVEQKSIQDYIAEAAKKTSRIVTIAICLPLSHQAIAAALYLPDSVYKDSLQVLTYQRLSGYIVNNIACGAQAKDYKYSIIRPFGMIDEGYDKQLDDDTRAKMVSYVYDSFYSLGHCDVDFKEYDAEAYQKDWLEKEEGVSSRWSSKFNANTISIKLRSIGYSDEMSKEQLLETVDRNIANMAAVEHNRWNIEKLLTGFRMLTHNESEQMTEFRKLGESDGYKAWSQYRKTLKAWPERAHLDLCPNEKLTQVDPDICHFDVDLSRAIANIVFMNKA